MSRNTSSSSSSYSNSNMMRMAHYPATCDMAPLMPPTPTPLSLPLHTLMMNSSGMHSQLQPSLYGQTVNQHHELNGSYDTSKSMMFGIPRDCPRPTVSQLTTLDADTLNLNKQLCDISLNTDEISMYQQQSRPAPVGADTFSFSKKLPNDSMLSNPKSILKNSTERLNNSVNLMDKLHRSIEPASYLPPIQPSMNQPTRTPVDPSSAAAAAASIHEKLLENQSLFLLDEYMDKNTSMNTKALAMKYLKNGAAKTPTSLYNSGNVDRSSMSAAATAFNHKPFQYYDYKSNSTTLFTSGEQMSTISGDNLFKKVDNLYKNYQDNQLSDINLSSLTVTSSSSSCMLPASSSTNHKYQYKCYVDSNSADKNSNDDDDEDNDDDLWVFGKPDGKQVALLIIIYINLSIL